MHYVHRGRAGRGTRYRAHLARIAFPRRLPTFSRERGPVVIIIFAAPSGRHYFLPISILISDGLAWVVLRKMATKTGQVRKMPVPTNSPAMGKANFLLQQLLDNSRRMPSRVAQRMAMQQGSRPTIGDSVHPSRNLDLLQSIHTWRDRGKSFGAIAALLNQQGLSGRYGARWYASSVRAYLQRRS